MKRAIAVWLASMLFLSTAVYAAPEFTVEYDPVTQKTTVSGAADGDVTVVVTENGVTLSDLSDSKLPVDFHQITADQNFVYDFFMPTKVPYGKYHIYLTDGDGTNVESFISFDLTQADTLIQNVINKAENETAFIKAVRDNAEKLGIDIENADYSDSVLKLMYALSKTYSGSQAFISQYHFCLGVSALKGKNAEETQAALQKYAKSLQLDYDKDFVNDVRLSEAAKAYLLTTLAKLDYASVYQEAERITGAKAFRAVYMAYSAMAAVLTAESWKAVEKLYTESYSFMKENIVNANRSYDASSAGSVFSAMMKMTYQLPADLANNFNTAVSAAAGAAGTSTPSRGNGGGGGGGSSVSAPSTVVSSSQFEGLPTGSTEVLSYVLPILSGSEDFSDVSAAAWYYEPVRILAGSGIISGDGNGSFRPDEPITRAEFAKLIVSAFSVSGSEKQFDDVAPEAWYAPYIQKAAGAEIVMGDNGQFRPNEYISRQDAAVMIYRLTKLFEVEYVGFQQSSDMHEVALYAWTAVGSLYSNGIIGGVGSGRFAPLEPISRAQAAQLLYNVITNLKEKVSEVG